MGVAVAASGRKVELELLAVPSGTCRAVGPGRWFSGLGFEPRGGGPGADIVPARFGGMILMLIRLSQSLCWMLVFDVVVDEWWGGCGQPLQYRGSRVCIALKDWRQ